MKSLVTGGAGFIGSNLVDVLIEAGEDVVILDNLCEGKKEYVHPKATFIEGDIRDEKCLDKAMAGVDVVYHQGALRSVPKSVENPAEFVSVNIEGTLKVLLACRKKKARIVFASSSSIYGDNPVFPQAETLLDRPVSPYAATKRAGEMFCRIFSVCYGAPTCSLRYFNVYGPRQDPLSEYAAVVACFILKALQKEPLEIHGDGEQSRDFTFVKDCVKANRLAAQKEFQGEWFNVAGGTTISVNQIANAIESTCGYHLKRIHTPPRPGDVRKTWADMRQSREKLGFSPDYPFEKGLEETFDYFRNLRAS